MAERWIDGQHSSIKRHLHATEIRPWPKNQRHVANAQERLKIQVRSKIKNNEKCSKLCHYTKIVIIVRVIFLNLIPLLMSSIESYLFKQTQTSVY